MAKAKKEKAVEEAQPQTEIPASEREFTSREKGGHVVYLQRMEVEANGNKGNKVTKRAITVRIMSGVKFDPFVECGPQGKNRNFSDLDPMDAWDALKAKEAERGSPIVFWDDRPMTEQESEHSKQIKTAHAALDEQKAANAKLRELCEANGLEVPEDI